MIEVRLTPLILLGWVPQGFRTRSWAAATVVFWPPGARGAGDALSWRRRTPWEQDACGGRGYRGKLGAQAPHLTSYPSHPSVLIAFTLFYPPRGMSCKTLMPKGQLQETAICSQHNRQGRPFTVLDKDEKEEEQQDEKGEAEEGKGMDR